MSLRVFASLPKGLNAISNHSLNLIQDGHLRDACIVEIDRLRISETDRYGLTWVTWVVNSQGSQIRFLLDDVFFECIDDQTDHLVSSPLNLWGKIVT